jgi:membrane protein YqaA with SNARE-associated domain
MIATVFFLAVSLLNITKTYRYAIIAIAGTFAGAIATMIFHLSQSGL